MATHKGNEFTGGQNSTVAAKHAPKVAKKPVKNNPGCFAGWISEEYRVAWVVSPHRADQRTGWVQGLGP